MMDSRVSDNLNRATTNANQDLPIRNQVTNIGPADLRPAESADLFVIQDDPNRISAESYNDNLQLTRFESNMNPLQSPPTQLGESSPEREESPTGPVLSQALNENTERRGRQIGTMNSGKDEDHDKDKERSLHVGEKAGEEH